MILDVGTEDEDAERVRVRPGADRERVGDAARESGSAVPASAVSPPSAIRSRCHWRMRAVERIPALRARSGSAIASAYGQP
jgi:hypothetical protein